MMLKILTGMRSISAILSAQLILDCVLFISKFFIKQLHLMISYLKLTVKIPLTVIFVISFQNLFFIFFVNVTLLDPFEKSRLRSSKTSIMLILPLRILIRSLIDVFGDKFLTYLFLCRKYHITLVNFKTKDPLFQVLRCLIKIIESVSMLLQKSGTDFLFILKYGDLNFSLFFFFLF